MDSLSNSNEKKLVYLDHDGSPEDTVCIMILLRMKNVEVIGVTLTRRIVLQKRHLS